MKKTTFTKWPLIVLIIAITVSAAIMSCQKVSLNDQLTSGGKAAPKSKMDAPILTCGTATQVSLNLTVTAGATGAPAGFSIQWMTVDQLAALNGIWPSSDLMCHASFSGNANASRYNLGPNESITVNIGELLLDNGASSNCTDALICGTRYVFRAFAHANSTLQRSDFTANKICLTLVCGADLPGCTFTQGYWKTHGPVGCASGNNTNVWPVTGLTLGTVAYTDVQLCNIFQTPAAGNGILTLAHQLIAAKLNIAKGASSAALGTAIADADALIGGLVVPPVGGGSLDPFATSTLVTILTNYNEGATGPGHCD